MPCCEKIDETNHTMIGLLLRHRPLIFFCASFLCLLVAVARSEECSPGSGVPSSGCLSTQIYSVCPSGACSDFEISCAPTDVRRTSFTQNEHARVIIAPTGAKNVTIRFLEVGMGTGVAALIYECSSLQHCRANCATQPDCERNLRLIGYQVEFIVPDLKTFTSNTGFMILYWVVPPETWPLSSGFRATITAEPNFPACAACLVGTYQSEYGRYACVPCPLNTYGPMQGMTSCPGCEIGKYSQDVVGASACRLCGAGSYGLVGSVGSYCPSCAPGTYNPYEGMSSCLACPMGAYAAQYASVQCDLCLPGSFTLHNGSASCGGLCKAGSYGSVYGGQSNATCVQCSAAKYTSVPGQGWCTPCPGGTYGVLLGQTTCGVCGAGTFSNVTGLTACLKCHSGTYGSVLGGDSEWSSCSPCAAGTFSSQPGVSACTPCPAGRYGNSTGTTACAPCPPGTFTSGQGMVHVLNCTLCGIGTYQPQYESTVCLPCPPGLFGVALGSTSCQFCQDGYFLKSSVSLCASNFEFGSAYMFHLITCASGMLLREPYGNSEYSEATIAPPGAVSIALTFAKLTTERDSDNIKIYSCLTADACTQSCSTYDTCDFSYIAEFSGTKIPAQFISPSGVVRVVWKSDPETLPSNSGWRMAFEAKVPGNYECAQCPAGTYTSGANSTACTLCPKGTYYGGSESAQCAPCPGGTYGVVLGALNVSSGCNPCLPGSFSTAGSTVCSVCLLGTHNNRSGASACTPCQAGTYGVVLGALNVSSGCYPCLPGSFSSAGSTVCSVCLLGTYSNRSSAAACTPCQAGTHGVGGVGAVNASACLACPDGKYISVGGSTACLACEPCLEDGYYKLGCALASAGECVRCTNNG